MSNKWSIEQIREFVKKDYQSVAARMTKCLLGYYDELLISAHEPYDPYFGWCDVDGCENEACSGGYAWRETGYWRVCYKHSDHYRNGKPSPQMKQSAIDREKRRDPVTGYLSNDDNLIIGKQKQDETIR